jgi:metallo-beta-lactamase family protein
MTLKLTFFGAARSVTGSCYLLEVDNSRLLVDCGLYQERPLRERNWAPFPIPPNTIDAALLTHAHLDHCGLLPKLVRDGFRGPIYCTPATREITEIMLLDSATIQEEDAEFKKLRHQKEGRKGPYPEVPLYTVRDAEATIPLLTPVAYQKTIEIADSVSATFFDAGHVLGSAMIEIVARQGTGRRKLLFSGDIGRWNKPILHDPTVFTEADYAIMESTYGNRELESPEEAADRLAAAINATVKAGGNIVIPSFALERSQEMLFYLNKFLIEDRIPHLLVFFDSPMAANINEVFAHHIELLDDEMKELVRQKRSPFDFPGLKLVRTTDESKAINHISGTVIIIAGSGMCTGGRIKHHLANNISRRESTIIFVGYQAEGTLGREIVDGARKVRILGKRYRVKARIVQIEGFSAHADKNELLKWVLNLRRPPRQLFITHGESQSAEHLATAIREKTGWNVAVPEYRQEFLLD